MFFCYTKNHYIITSSCQHPAVEHNQSLWPTTTTVEKWNQKGLTNGIEPRNRATGHSVRIDCIEQPRTKTSGQSSEEATITHDAKTIGCWIATIQMPTVWKRLFATEEHATALSARMRPGAQISMPHLQFTIQTTQSNERTHADAA